MNLIGFTSENSTNSIAMHDDDDIVQNIKLLDFELEHSKWIKSN